VGLENNLDRQTKTNRRHSHLQVWSSWTSSQGSARLNKQCIVRRWKRLERHLLRVE